METQRKNIDPLVIRFVATALILATRSTTNTDVKKSLQRRGYQYGADEVSQWLLVICFWESWAIKDNGKHRIYSFSGKAVTVSTDN